MAKRGFSIWDIIAWIVLIGIAIWLILKVLGIINSPDWLEYSPLFGAVYLAGWAMHKLEIVSNDVKELKKFKDATINEINKITTNCVKNHKK